MRNKNKNTSSSPRRCTCRSCHSGTPRAVGRFQGTPNLVGILGAVVFVSFPGSTFTWRVLTCTMHSTSNGTTKTHVQQGRRHGPISMARWWHSKRSKAGPDFGPQTGLSPGDTSASGRLDRRNDRCHERETCRTLFAKLDSTMYRRRKTRPRNQTEQSRGL